MLPKELLPANYENLIRIAEKLDEWSAGGASRPEEAFGVALDMMNRDQGKDKIIIFVADGIGFDAPMRKVIAEKNPGGNIRIHCVSWGATQEATKPLREIAEENGGKFIDVNPDDL